MIIEQIYIEKYGKFKNFSMNFKDGVNIIFGENERGKSTLLNFIVHVLYGDNSRSKDLDKNLRIKYMPWKETQSRGYIILRKNQTRYRIERLIDSIRKYDQLRVINILTGEEVLLEKTISPGQYFFGLNRDEFLNLLFISSEKPAYSSDLVKADIRQRLINLNETGNENISYSTAINKLDDRIYSIQSKSKNKGYLVEKSKAYEDERLRYERARGIEDKKASEYKNYLNDLRSLQLKKETLRAYREMKEITDRKAKLKYDKKTYEEDLLKDKMLVKLGLELEKLEEDQKKLKMDLKKNDIKMMVFSGICLLAFSLLFFFNKFFLVGSLLALIVFIYEYLKNRKLTAFNRQRQVEIFQLQGSIKAKKENLSQIRKDFLEKNNFLKEKILSIEKEESKLANTLGRLREKHGDYIEDADIKLAGEIERDEEDLLDRKIDLSANYRLDKSSSSIYNELVEMEKEIESLKIDLDLLEATKKELLAAYKDLQKEFTPRLNDLTSKIVERISHGKYDSLLISSDFNLSFIHNETRDLVDFNYLSAGTIEQFYLSLKLAIINLSIEKSLRILLLDDAFIRFDKGRFKSSFEMLEDDFLEFSQIIYVTCREDFKNLDLKANIIEL